jgi:hypothetical protein
VSDCSRRKSNFWRTRAVVELDSDEYDYGRKKAENTFRSGKNAMLTTEENELLCRVENNAPMGRLMQRHWVPACMSEEVAEPDGAPVRIIAAETTGGGDLYWYVKSDSPIKTLKDTDGKTMAYSTNGSSTHGIVTAFVKQFRHVRPQPNNHFA